MKQKPDIDRAWGSRVIVIQTGRLLFPSLVRMRAIAALNRSRPHSLHWKPATGIYLERHAIFVTRKIYSFQYLSNDMKVCLHISADCETSVEENRPLPRTPSAETGLKISEGRNCISTESNFME